ncbi:hypothetical protein EFA69_17425 [Rufibacter immobilis]|uniref:Uncharacterized protein n=1 Tax=Rufibacter immobilis TaxID=1348778 RepID=A0A3M9MQQ8_9BACT|nr:hypothetical protein [Rufibacter immobilis]RNI27874.1 hypothetical protein EFA69_17425 [Rufibacter immobilis]
MMMNQVAPQRQHRTKTKAFITGSVTVFIFCFLFWEHGQGGVGSHHLLAQQSLPAISNWWGGLLLPVLTWYLVGRTEKRLGHQASQVKPWSSLRSQVLRLFITGLVLGVLIAVSFSNGYSLFLDNVPYLIVALSLLIPIYYAEFILGFILGMTVTFGVILPTLFILLLAGIGFLIYRFIRPMIMKLTLKLMYSLHKNPNR